ncbi:peptidase inhibitor family I36 protein [Catenuloplanes indicus]|uniref:Peptidase inhibitor family I36 n=1 Tax=Catenuloplanes indicus TaxID=137267 RepID=A0AAE3W6V7_9ACTN|nr:peptidase inhibitor family I36 protein [Catenuloplanes indicus]MDQ0369520.1 hypothetical protein [Catenuloplanes indicus]
MNILKKAIAGGALAVVATAALAAGTASSASAGWSDCAGGDLCAYLSANGGGTPGRVADDNANLLQYNKFNNAVSLYNNGNSCNVRIYSGLNWSGSSFVLPRGYTAPDLSGTVYYKNVASNDWCV